MPKKNKRNAYSVFAAEYKDNQKAKGRLISMEQAISEAAKYWEKMTKSEKDAFKKKAKIETVQGKNANEKYTSQGVPISYIENEKREKDAEERLMKKDVEEIINNAVIKDVLEKQEFYFIMANYFIRINEDDLYVPAEIALCVYNLQQGVQNTFHSFVNPGELRFGHAFEAQQHADLIHKLPLPPKAMGEENYSKLFREILKFIGPSDGTKGYRPLFTSTESLPVVKSILEQMDENIILKVYPIQYLFHTLKKATATKGQNPMPESIHVTNAIFERDPFEYQQGISCHYHEENDVSKFCALSSVVRWGYMFSDYMCNDIALALVPGRHVPVDVDLKAFGDVNATMDYYDNDDGQISTSQFDTRSDITLPNVKHYRCKEEGSSVVTMTSIEKDFPALGSDRRKRLESRKFELDQRSVASSSQKVKADETINDDDDDDDDDDDSAVIKNPWAARSRKTPRPPKEDSFSYGLVSGGHGRGNLIKQEPENKIPKPSMGGFGRGRLFRE